MRGLMTSVSCLQNRRYKITLLSKRWTSIFVKGAWKLEIAMMCYWRGRTPFWSTVSLSRPCIHLSLFPIRLFLLSSPRMLWMCSQCLCSVWDATKMSSMLINTKMANYQNFILTWTKYATFFEFISL